MIRALILSLALLSPHALLADPPQIVAVKVRDSGMGWDISVTVQHNDTGWDHYASGWEVLDEAGNRLAYRKLHHPHVTEQPFTRSLHSVLLPDGTRKVYIVAHCSTGETSTPVKVKLER
ncbi:hypothetical protein [Pseudooceanicola sp. LIPI14-2-Ac024]|uniref:hypothetical protein n=1 Tax=Pseudooceanicola sp. LIPI14-2-Ac024 TaxID=3344875 RepID=UPI0035CFCB76